MEVVRVAYAELEPSITIWWRQLAAPAAIMPDLSALLSPPETARAARFGHATSRERYIIGRSTLRMLLSKLLDTEPAQVPIVRTARGRPMLDAPGGIDFNVSHTRDVIVYAIGAGLSPGVQVGIDIEHVDRLVNVTRLGRKLLTAEERDALEGCSPEARRRAFLATWTCKEAMSKATGDGLRAPFGQIAVESGDAPRVLDGPGLYRAEAWELHRVPVLPEYLVTVAVQRAGAA